MLLGAVMLLTIGGVGTFLRNYVGDLYFWTTYQETSEKHQKREEILDRCCTYLTHVLLDKNCERVVLVGHSMGTTVAHDTILRLTHAKPQTENNGKRPRRIRLDKIQHFITLASVIDKVHYLFETVTSKSFRYTRIIDSVRKDLGEPPFSEKAGQSKPRIHWINFWDRADVASERVVHPCKPSVPSTSSRR